MHRGRTEADVVAYPFASRPTAHRVRLNLEREVYAACALDALGTAFLLTCPVEVLSRDPLTAEEIWVRLEPDGGGWWEPAGTVLLWGVAAARGPSALTCCPFVHFFPAANHARRYAQAQRLPSSRVLSMPEAIDLAARLFGGVLPEDARRRLCLCPV